MPQKDQNPVPTNPLKQGNPAPPGLPPSPLEKKRAPKRRQIRMQMKFNLRTFLLWLAFLFFGIPLVVSLLSPTNGKPEIPLSVALKDIKDGQVSEVLIDGDRLLLTYSDGKEEVALKEPSESAIKTFETAGINPQSINLKVKDVSFSRIWSEILFSLLPILGMGFLLLILFRKARGAQDNLFSFGQSKARLFSKGKQDVKFTDVAGCDEAKNELEEIVDFLKNPQKYRKLGARTPKGVILIGPSGVGKTLLAKAVAGEAKVAFFSMAGSEFMEMLVGVGASRVRDLFATAKKSAPAIIFIDEVDAIGRQRGSGFAGAHDEREQTLNQILVEMDGFLPNDNVVVLAATNRGDLLDPALLRPGRFDRRVMLDMPDLEGRKGILAIHARGKPFEKSVDWDKVAKRTVGFSGADLENMLNEAAILAARNEKKAIDAQDIEEAATKVKLGPKKRRLQTDLEKRMTAYHEAGHAIVSFYLPRLDPVHRISIVARGMALGFTMIPPQVDRYTETKSRLDETIISLLGGRAAEEIEFNEFTGGAASDLDKATRIARNMVEMFGMSELGPVYWGPQIDVSEIGKRWFQPTQISNDMQAKIDTEIKRILKDAYAQSLKILKEKRDKLDIIAAKLVEVETLEGEEFEKLIGEPRPQLEISQVSNNSSKS
jgi:cell division protease FtsH